MEMRKADVADRYTILLLKEQHGKIATTQERLPLHGILDADNIDYRSLLHINALMWDIEEAISRETDLAGIGIKYLALRQLNTRRIAERNRISQQFNEPLELKSY